jgi:transcriptional regulator with XRE-family HTH domain
MAFDLSMSHTLARLPVVCKHAYGSRGFNPAYMGTLQERMVELMTATGWTVGEIARIAGVTSAAVSQWVGNGAGKQSKSIGNAEAALRLEKASGFSWIWLAQGKGPKLRRNGRDQGAGCSQEVQLGNALEVLTKALQKADKNTRIALEPLLVFYGERTGRCGAKVTTHP